MNGTDKGYISFIHISQRLCKNIFGIILYADVLKGRNDPSLPPSGSLCIIYTFCSRKIKTFFEVVLPRHKGMCLVRHRPPKANKIPVFIFFDQVSDFPEMGICIQP